MSQRTPLRVERRRRARLPGVRRGPGRPRLHAGVRLARRPQLGEPLPRAVPARARRACARDPHRPSRLGLLGPLLARRRRAARGAGRRPRRGDGRGRLRARRHLRLVGHGAGRDAVRGDVPGADGRPGAVRSRSRRTAPRRRRPGCTRRRSGRRSTRRSGAPGERPGGSDEGFTDEREFLDWFVPWSRASVAPGALVAEGRAFYRTDVRAILPSIHVPTLSSASETTRAGRTPWSGTPRSSRSGSPARA